MITDCVLWVGKTKGRGYGAIGNEYAHRVVFQREFGPIPTGWHIHHLCGVKLCVSVEHLELVTRKQHAERHLRDRCKRGHEFSETNTYVDPGGFRHCRICRLDAVRRHAGWKGGVHSRDKLYCPEGHPLFGENVRIQKGKSGPQRVCRTCRSRVEREYRARRKALA